MTEAERADALEAIASEIAHCTRCRLHQGRARAVPGEGNADTEVIFVGEAPGFNEDRQGRPFVGRAGAKLDDWIASLGWRRSDVFITNVVKCRPPDNRDPLPDEIATCAPFLKRQLEALDPAVVVTLGRYSMAAFMPGARISQAHGTARPADPATGAPDATVVALYHPAAALRSPDVDAQARADVVAIPTALIEARQRREAVEVAETVEAAGGPGALASDQAVDSVEAVDIPADVTVDYGAEMAQSPSVDAPSSPSVEAPSSPSVEALPAAETAPSAGPPPQENAARSADTPPPTSPASAGSPGPGISSDLPSETPITVPSPALEPARPDDQLTLF